jgi:hypothetical protein
MSKKPLRKGKYKVLNWPEYNKALKNRGDLTIWFSEEGIGKWFEEDDKDKKPGRQREYGDEAIKTMYIIRQVFNLRLRQTEGFVESILKIMKLALPVPDYTTLARRARGLNIDFVVNKAKGAINLILDSTGIKVVGEKEWNNHKHGGPRERNIWRKLHIGVTDDGNIVAGEVTTLRGSDIATVPDLLKQTTTQIDRVVGDSPYYEKRMEEPMNGNDNTKDAKFVGTPGNGDKNYGNRLKVEETFSRYKRIIGNTFKAKHFEGKKNEAKLSLLILNMMQNIGMPFTVRVA